MNAWEQALLIAYNQVRTFEEAQEFKALCMSRLQL